MKSKNQNNLIQSHLHSGKIQAKTVIQSFPGQDIHNKKKIHMEPIKTVFYAEDWEWRMGTKMHKYTKQERHFAQINNVNVP